MPDGAHSLARWKIFPCHIKNLFSSVSGLLQLHSAIRAVALSPCLASSSCFSFNPAAFVFLKARLYLLQLGTLLRLLLRLNLPLQNCRCSDLEVCQSRPQGDGTECPEHGKMKTSLQPSSSACSIPNGLRSVPCSRMSGEFVRPFPGVNSAHN